MNLDAERILAADLSVPNDSRSTRLNNNDLVIGPPGCGKTRNYVKPNLLQFNESFIVTETKGELVAEISPALEDEGYDVMHVDFTDPERSPWGYNPLDFVHVDAAQGMPSERHVVRISELLSPVRNTNDPFWDNLAKLYVQMLIDLILQEEPDEQRDLCTMADIIADIPSGFLDMAMREISYIKPNCLARKRYDLIRAIRTTERTYGSALTILAEKASPLALSCLKGFYHADRRVDFGSLGRSATALFLTVSDSDRSLDPLVSLIYSQAMQELFALADSSKRKSLPVPVRLYLDDFACGYPLHDFDNLLSTMRSRNIAASIVIQSLPQLEAMYGRERSRTIVNNCDHILYMGGKDVETARLMAYLAHSRTEKVLRLEAGKLYLAQTGDKATIHDAYKLESHPRYSRLPEFRDWAASLERYLEEDGHAA